MRMLALFPFVLALAGCATVANDMPPDFREAELADAEPMPPAGALAAERIKAVAFEIEDGGFQAARNANLRPFLTGLVERALTEAGVEIVDRDMARRLREELRLAEARGQGRYAGPAVAQYSVSGAVTKAQYINRRDEGGILSNLLRSGKSSDTEQIGVVEAVLRVHELPSLREVAVLTLAGQHRETNRGNETDILAQVLQRAAEASIKPVTVDLSNAVAPRGAVLERRSDGKNTLYKVAFGREQRIRPGLKVQFQEHAAAGAEPVVVATGTVGDFIGARHAWVRPDRAQDVAVIRRGHVARIVYEKGLLERFLP